MKSLRLLLVHAYFESLELLRQPMYLVSTVVFPSMFFWFFGAPNATEEIPARILTGSFAAFGVLGVMVFQFSVAIAQERRTPWSALLKILPMASWIPLYAKLLSGIFFSIPTISGVLWVAHLTTPVNLSLTLVLKIFATLMLAGLPFGLLGICIGQTCSAKSVLPVANLVYLPLSFAGGLWLPPNALPELVQNISEYLPTRYLGEIIWSVTLEQPFKQAHINGLIVYFVIFFMMAFWLRRRCATG